MSPERKESGEKFDFVKSFNRSINHICINLHRSGKRDLDLARFEDRREYITQRGIVMVQIGKYPSFPVTPQTATAALTLYELIKDPKKSLSGRNNKEKEEPKNSQELKNQAFLSVKGNIKKQREFIKIIERAERLAKKLPDKSTI